jgi:hypothetical protein
MGMRKKRLAGLSLALIVLTVFVLIVTAIPFGRDPASVQAADGDSATSGLSLTVRTDLTGTAGPVAVGRPVFVQLNDGSGASGPAATETMLYVDGVRSSDLEVRVYRSDEPCAAWVPSEDAQGVHGILPKDDAGAGQGSNGSGLLVVAFSQPGHYALEAVPVDTASGEPAGQPARVEVEVEQASYLFEAPTLGPWSTSGWQERIGVGSEMNFSIASNTTDLWRRTENWTEHYNWTVTVINPEGMVVGGDLAKYNTGALNLDRGDLNRTSVVSAWENGYNSVFYTVWDNTTGVRLSGAAAMTPTGKEITYGGGVWDAWTKGTWRPSGVGYITFHHDGHYLFVFTLTKDGRVVAPSLVQEVVVS